MKKILVILAIVIVALGGGAFVYSQTIGRDATIGCNENEDGSIDCNIHIAPGAMAEGTCLPKDIMVHSDIHDDVKVWYALTQNGPRPVGVSDLDESCIRPY